MIQIAQATPAQRDAIYRLRHCVYATELEQHPINEDKSLTDALDTVNEYLVALDTDGSILGFVSLTPPSAGHYSLDKYFPRTYWPFPADEALWEVRLLTVLPHKRQGNLAMLLMQAALRRVESAGGRRIAGIGREELKSLYASSGLAFHGLRAHSGAVTYELMSAPVATLSRRADELRPLLARLLSRVQWSLPFPPWPSEPASVPCYHGGAFFSAIGSDFATLEKRHAVVNADVLDAWFDPAPTVTSALTEHLPWLLKTSPPTQCEGLIAAIARARELPTENLVVGGGSSELIFRAFTHWLTPDSRVLLPDPSYGEYAHVLESVVGCQVERLPLTRTNGWQLDATRLQEKVASGRYALCVLIHPSNPTGTLTPRETLRAITAAAAPGTRLWIDEAYVDYVGREHSLEPLVTQQAGLFVCKSLSKAYALSGARAAYLAGPKDDIAALRRRTPPWTVGLPAQLAAVEALAATDYYEARWQETHVLRTALAATLRTRLPGSEVEESVANWLVLYLPHTGPDAAEVCRACVAHGVFLRELTPTTRQFGSHALRIAVKDAATNEKIVTALVHVCHRP